MTQRVKRWLAGIVDVVVIGAGHSGLAMSHVLGQRAIEHVVLERGEVANSWRTERWDSLRLLTPNWMCRLPGYRYQGDDPDGYMSVDEVVDFRVRLCQVYVGSGRDTHDGDSGRGGGGRLPRVDQSR